jgi:hypothetical protein
MCYFYEMLYTLNLYIIESDVEAGKWCISSLPENIVGFFTKCLHFIYRKNKSPVIKTTIPRGNLTNAFLSTKRPINVRLVSLTVFL